MAVVSVIVPVYNAEKYLVPCVESVLAQTMPDWELLLVDDGSADASPALCRHMRERDRRIRVIGQQNAGASAARNAGLDAATGEYVAFLDADDRYAAGMLETLLTAARRERADIAACGAVVVGEDGRAPERLSLQRQVLHGPESITENFLRGEHGLYCVWNKLYRRELIGETRFRPFTRGEDALFNAELMIRCTVYVSTDSCQYEYLKRAGSVTSEGFGPRTVDLVNAWAEVYRAVDPAFPALGRIAAEKVIHETDKCFRQGWRSAPSYWPEVRRELAQRHNMFFLRQYPENVPARKRAADMLYRLSPELYYRLTGGK